MNARRLLAAVSVILAFMLAPGFASAAEWNNDTDRPGLDYTSFPLSEAHPMTQAHRCRTACDNDARCRAWTFVRRNIQGPSAVCWLKHSVPAPRPNTCCVSGVK